MVELGREDYFGAREIPSVAVSRAKRTFDIAIALFLIVFLLPVLGLVAIAVLMDSPGPVLFRQKRAGLNQQPFCIYKFRTMNVMEDGDSITQAEKYDTRVTRVGAFLRRSSIDELPQLFNVLRGEMSLIGPRPHALAHDREYGLKLAHYAERFRAKPGITGWAQVNGLRGQTGTLRQMELRVDYDKYYIDNWSLAFDLAIFVRTVVTAPFQKAAY